MQEMRKVTARQMFRRRSGCGEKMRSSSSDPGDLKLTSETEERDHVPPFPWLSITVADATRFC